MTIHLDLNAADWQAELDRLREHEQRQLQREIEAADRRREIRRRWAVETKLHRLWPWGDGGWK